MPSVHMKPLKTNTVDCTIYCALLSAPKRVKRAMFYVENMNVDLTCGMEILELPSKWVRMRDWSHHCHGCALRMRLIVKSRRYL